VVRFGDSLGSPGQRWKGGVIGRRLMAGDGGLVGVVMVFSLDWGLAVCCLEAGVRVCRGDVLVETKKGGIDKVDGECRRTLCFASSRRRQYLKDKSILSVI
jgi:hypothetical protein